MTVIISKCIWLQVDPIALGRIVLSSCCREQVLLAAENNSVNAGGALRDTSFFLPSYYANKTFHNSVTSQCLLGKGSLQFISCPLVEIPQSIHSSFSSLQTQILPIGLSLQSYSSGVQLPSALPHALILCNLFLQGLPGHICNLK